ncbi:MAG: glycoside hydrolase family 2 TIM barrel-domain containing protein [Clostridia bacterium]
MKYNFNFGWKFHHGDLKGRNFDSFASDKYEDPSFVKVGNNGLARPNFDDSAWENVKLPHDFVIEKCDFTDEESDSVGSLRKGKAWYRKTFVLPKDTDGKRIFMRFDGVFRDSQVWCNGHFMGRHLGGYLGFTYELTEVLNRDKSNTIAVFADATGYEGWWYEGGGMYRDVYLIATNDIRVSDVFAKPYNINLDEKTCDVDVEVELDSNKFTDENCTYNVEISDPNGIVVANYSKEVTANPLALTSFKESVKLENVVLWDLDSPCQYAVKATVTANGQTEELVQKFGVREFIYNAKDGATLNGKHITLDGVCGHDDLAGVGTALNKSAVEYKIKTLQSIGCNSYRCSHNPPSPLFLEACDELGFLVMDEHRLPGTSYECIDDFKALIKRDRNHPSVIFYSMGNEEMGIQETKVGVAIFSKLIAIGTMLDDSRDYLFAVNCQVPDIVQFLNKNGYVRHIHGANYLKPKVGDKQHLIIHEQNPDMCFVSTETSGVCSIRGFNNKDNTPEISKSGSDCGVYYNEAHKNLVTCYGDCGPFWGLTPQEALEVHDDKPYFLGQYLWTGFDYRGEVFPYVFPQVITSFGILDLCGFYKDWAYYIKAWWGKEDVLHIFPSWNLPLNEGEKVSVWAFSNCDEVELFVNGVSKGRKTLERLGHLEWDVNYEKGEVLAVAYKNGVKTLEEKLVTSDKEYQIILSADKTDLIADNDDSAFITVEVVDKDGNYVTDSSIDIDFTIKGSATVKGTGNGDPKSLEHDKLPKRKLFAGKAMVIVESTFENSEIEVIASSNGVNSASVKLTSHKTKSLDNYVFSTNDVKFENLRERYIDL